MITAEDHTALAARIASISGCTEEVASVAAGSVLTYGARWAQSLDSSSAPAHLAGLYADAYAALMVVAKADAEAEAAALAEAA
jgi:hypothetical protein